MTSSKTKNTSNTSLLSRWAFLFALAFGAFLVLPAFLDQPLTKTSLVMRGDALDLFTPLVLLPLYYVLFVGAAARRPSLGEHVVFLILAAMWVEGQGIHLAANSIGHHIAKTDTGATARLAYLYDEVLGHYLWHAALMALSLAIVSRELKAEGREKTSWGWIAPGAVLYGVTFFLVVVEGQTAPIGAPFALLLGLAAWIALLRRPRHSPLLAFFALGYTVSVLFFAGWAAYWRGFPEFSAVGFL